MVSLNSLYRMRKTFFDLEASKTGGIGVRTTYQLPVSMRKRDENLAVRRAEREIRISGGTLTNLFDGRDLGRVHHVERSGTPVARYPSQVRT